MPLETHSPAAGQRLSSTCIDPSCPVGRSSCRILQPPRIAHHPPQQEFNLRIETPQIVIRPPLHGVEQLGIDAKEEGLAVIGKSEVRSPKCGVRSPCEVRSAKCECDSATCDVRRARSADAQSALRDVARTSRLRLRTCTSHSALARHFALRTHFARRTDFALRTSHSTVVH